MLEPLAESSEGNIGEGMDMVEGDSPLSLEIATKSLFFLGL
jgi:hypothetical protein